MRIRAAIPIGVILLIGLSNAAVSQQTVDLGPGVTITVDSLKRAGARAVRLDFSVRNSTGSRVDLFEHGLVRSEYFDVGSVSIIDYDAGLRYGALMDSEGECACSRGDANSGIQLIEDGASPSFFVLITAPPQDVASISIDFAGAALIDNVSIAP